MSPAVRGTAAGNLSQQLAVVGFRKIHLKMALAEAAFFPGNRRRDHAAGNCKHIVDFLAAVQIVERLGSNLILPFLKLIQLLQR